MQPDGERPLRNGRQTWYKGIRMRSRLEAQFAMMCDQWRAPYGWEYEPCAFADETGDYLPDFRLVDSEGRHYYEVRPHTVRHAELAVAFERMQVVWATDPAAVLHVALVRYGDAAPVRTFSAARGTGWREDLWSSFESDDGHDIHDVVWAIAESNVAYDAPGFDAAYAAARELLTAELAARTRALATYAGDPTRADLYAAPIWRAAVAATVDALAGEDGRA